MTHTHRWADAAHAYILRSDGASIPADPLNSDYQAALRAGIEPFVLDIDEARAALMAVVEAKARAIRVAVAGTDDATKLAVYREKYAVAVAALGGNAQALARLGAEAAARDETPAELAALVKSLGDLWTAAGLAIDAAYQGHKAAISQLTPEGAASYDPEAGWPSL